MSTLYSRQQTIAAMLTLVLVVLVFTFYGLRWFQGGALKGTQPKKGAWPPIVNMCPDFMVTYKHSDGSTYCYDVNNTYNGRTYSGDAPTGSNGFFNLETVGGIDKSQGYKIRNAAAGVTSPNANRLKDDAGTLDTNRKWPMLKTLESNAQDIIGNQTTSGKWLRWEGVWDGRSLTPNAAPLAP